MTRSTPSTYEEDFYAWTQEQAAALRAMPVVSAGRAVDIVHVAEEIEDLGKRDLREVTSHLSRLFEHMIKINSVPMSRDIAHWSSEAGNFRDAVVASFSPNMRRLLDIQTSWQLGRDRAERALRISAQVSAAPADCPFSIDDILSDPFDVDRMLQRFGTHR